MVKIEPVAANTAARNEQPSEASQTTERLRGAELRNLETGHPQYGKVTGVLIARVADGSPAARSGLREGDIITGVNRQNVGSEDDLQRALRNAGSPVALNVWREGGRLYVVLR
jgi:S1-C subfamily serine protease